MFRLNYYLKKKIRAAGIRSNDRKNVKNGRIIPQRNNQFNLRDEIKKTID